MARPPVGDHPMTPAERKRRQRERQREQGSVTPSRKADRIGDLERRVEQLEKVIERLACEAIERESPKIEEIEAEPKKPFGQLQKDARIKGEVIEFATIHKLQLEDIATKYSITVDAVKDIIAQNEKDILEYVRTHKKVPLSYVAKTYNRTEVGIKELLGANEVTKAPIIQSVSTRAINEYVRAAAERNSILYRTFFNGKRLKDCTPEEIEASTMPPAAPPKRKT